MEEPGRLQSMRSPRVGHDWATSLFTFMHWRRKWQPTPVFLPGESQGRDGGACWAAVYGVAQSRTRLKWLSSSSSNFIFSTWKSTYNILWSQKFQGVFFSCFLYIIWFICGLQLYFLFPLAWFASFKILCTARICYDKKMCLNMQLFLVAHLFPCSSVWSCQT